MKKKRVGERSHDLSIPNFELSAKTNDTYSYISICMLSNLQHVRTRQIY
jgi:hypothetical protein